MAQIVKTLIYKRTHRGDPDDSGIFGISDCMGKVRGHDFDAVIGGGGVAPDPGHQCIAEKLTWIGIGAHRVDGGFENPCVTFDWFHRWDETGPPFKALAPHLYRYMFLNQHVRHCLSQNFGDPCMQLEVERILSWARDTKHPTSPLIPERKPGRKCGCTSAETARPALPCRPCAAL